MPATPTRTTPKTSCRHVDGGSTASYVYDASGQRIRKVATGVTTDYVYDTSGSIAAEIQGSTGQQGTSMPEEGSRRIQWRLGASGATTLFVHKDHLGSTRVMTAMNGTVYDSMDYLPYGEQIAGGSTTTHKFTGKEHDAESGLDDFEARYFSSSLGRFQSPDQPGADQQPDDPQSWNLYSYVRNNPTGNVDPSGRACVSGLNDSSTYCQRADLYGNLDALVHDKTRFFAAASAASQQIADVEMPIAGRLETSSTTRAFLESTGQALEKENIQVVGKILSGDIKAEGPQLDAQIVHKEQNIVQSQLDNFSKANPTDYKTAIKEINVLLNSKDSGGAVLKGLVGLSNAAGTTDKAYSQVLDEARKSRGHALDFSNQKDREAIGIALANHIRKTGGCDVAGNKIQGCK